MTARIPCPEPGIYRGVPAAEYHAWDAASNSALGLMAGGRTPAHARYLLDNPPPTTPAKLRGDAAHALILESALFDARFVVPEPCGAVLKTGARAGEACAAPGIVLTLDGWRCGTQAHQGVPLADQTRARVAADDYALCCRMRDAVLAHPDAAALVAATPDREVSIVFDWPGTAVRCKARLDVPALQHAAIGDLKTTDDASAAAFARSVATYGYYRQDPFYRTGAEVLGFPVHDFYFIAVESQPPHGVAVYQLEASDVALGRAEIADLLTLWSRCTTSGRWPGYPAGVQALALPSWKRAVPAGIPMYEDEEIR